MSTAQDTAPVGLLAGRGRFPICFAEKARSLGIPVVCVGIKSEADPVLAQLCSRFYWAGVAKLGRIIRCFRRENVQQVIMAGKITKTVIYTPWRLLPDWRTIRMWFLSKRRDNKDDSILLGVIDEFAKDGIGFASALDLCPELLVKTGLLTKRTLSATETSDIEFGWDIARQMGGLDVGQSVAVKARSVLAVEAIEGTDQAILRAGELCRRRGFVVVKVAKPNQDMRFDVPTVGCQTIESMKQAGATVLAIEADKTIIIDQEETVALANRYHISIVARQAA